MIRSMTRSTTKAMVASLVNPGAGVGSESALISNDDEMLISNDDIILEANDD